MLVLLDRAWFGWISYISTNKLAAVFLALLLFLWLRKERIQKRFLLYTTITTILCMIPFSAAIIMAYQTQFYDYKWIWSIVPMTIMLAFGGTVFLADCLERFQQSKVRMFVVCFSFLAILMLSTGIGGNQAENESQVLPKYNEVEGVLSQLPPEEQELDITLWAPKEIMEYTRIVRGDIKLLYGRNMWDGALNAYSYDEYLEGTKSCYQWMNQLEETGLLEPTSLTDSSFWDSVDYVLDQGVNCICLPHKTQGELVQQLEEKLGVTAQKQGDYYWFNFH